jgi:hypothetical protein
MKAPTTADMATARFTPAVQKYNLSSGRVGIDSGRFFIGKEGRGSRPASFQKNQERFLTMTLDFWMTHDESHRRKKYTGTKR